VGNLIIFVKVGGLIFVKLGGLTENWQCRYYT
jgi:hypothetical protein